MTPGAQQAMALLAERSGFSPEELASFQDDPMAMLLMAAARRQQEARDGGGGDEMEALEQRALTAEAQLEDARRALRGARAAITSSQALLEYVARVLGSCQRCCGLNPLCPACGGEGRPGSRAPDREELLAWLQPALAHSGLAVVSAPHHTPKQGGLR
jgi:hypothetical protein